jgi:hypothetical protein
VLLYPAAPPPAITNKSTTTALIGVIELLAELAADVPLAFVATAVNV